MVMMLTIGLFGGCKQKDGGSDTSNASGQTGSKTASKTESRATAKSTNNTGSTKNASTGTSSTGSNENKVGQNTVVNESGEAAETVGEGNIDSGSADVSEDGGSGDAIKIVDLKGREIKIIIQSANQEPLPDTGNKVTDVRYKYMKEAEKLFNCKFTFELVTTSDNLVSQVEGVAMAGVYYADAFRMVHYMALPKWEKANIILPVNDYINLEHPVWKAMNHTAGLLNPQNVYSLAQEPPANTPFGTWYNMDILEREGIPNIHDYVDQGNWNWNTFLDIAMKTTRDLNGDGIIDQWGIGTEERFLGQCLLFSNAASIVAMSDSSQSGYVYNLGSPECIRAMQFFSDLYNNYKVVTPPKTNWTKLFREGKIAMCVYEAWRGNTLKSWGLTNLGYDILPLGPDNPNGLLLTPTGGGHSFFFPSNLKDPEGVVNAIAYWHAIWDDSREEYVTVEDNLMAIAQERLYTQRDIDALFRINRMEIKYDYYNYFDPIFTLVQNQVFGPAATINTTAASAIEAIRYQAQEIIDSKMSGQ